MSEENEKKRLVKKFYNSLADPTFRERMAGFVSGGYDFADALHNVYLDYGYPASLSFFNFWNMYRRGGIPKNVVELPTDTGWVTNPIIEAPDQFTKELEALDDKLKLWNRLKTLDTRQRVGRYAGLFFRVKDGKKPDEEIGELNGIGSVVQIIPLYEGQLKVSKTQDDITADDYGMPTMYQYTASGAGNRSSETQSSFNIHPSRLVVTTEESDGASIYGFSSLEAPYNSLLDLRKVIGGGAEGFYRNAAQSIIFKLMDGASAIGNEDLLEDFNEQYDEFTRNRMRRAMWTPGLDPEALQSTLVQPKEFFNTALNDVAASCKIPATILIGQQTGRLASSEDSKHFLATINSRRENYMTELVMDVIDWLIKYRVLPDNEYAVSWDDLLALSKEEKLANADKMTSINERQFKSGAGTVFQPEEIREEAGFEPEELPEDMGETLEEDEDEDEG